MASRGALNIAPCHDRLLGKSVSPPKKTNILTIKRPRNAPKPQNPKTPFYRTRNYFAISALIPLHLRPSPPLLFLNHLGLSNLIRSREHGVVAKLSQLSDQLWPKTLDLCSWYRSTTTKEQST